MNQLQLNVELILKQTIKNEDVAAMYKSPLQRVAESVGLKYRLCYTFTINIKKNTLINISRHYLSDIVEITNVIGIAGFGFSFNEFKKCEPGDFVMHSIHCYSFGYIYAIEDTDISFSIYNYSPGILRNVDDWGNKDILNIINGGRSVFPSQEIYIDTSCKYEETYLDHRRGGNIKIIDDSFIIVGPLKDFKEHCIFPLWHLYDALNLYYDPLIGIEQCK